jgi:hypothetical protein
MFYFYVWFLCFIFHFIFAITPCSLLYFWPLLTNYYVNICTKTVRGTLVFSLVLICQKYFINIPYLRTNDSSKNLEWLVGLA